MSQNSAAHLARVEHAVKTLLKAPNLTVPEAMYLAKFLEEDIANESIQRGIRRRLPGGTKKGLKAVCSPPMDIGFGSQSISTMSPLTGDVSTSIPSPIPPQQQPTKPPPKRGR